MSKFTMATVGAGAGSGSGAGSNINSTNSTAKTTSQNMNAWSRPLTTSVTSMATASNATAASSTSAKMIHRPSATSTSTTTTTASSNKGLASVPSSSSQVSHSSSNNNNNNNMISNSTNHNSALVAALRERFLHLTLNLIGQVVQVTLTDGSVLEGVLYTFTPFQSGGTAAGATPMDDCYNKYILKSVHVVHNSPSKILPNVEKGGTVVIPVEKVSYLMAKSVRLGLYNSTNNNSNHGTHPDASMSTSASQKSGAMEFQTDSDISTVRKPSLGVGSNNSQPPNNGTSEREFVMAGSIWTTAPSTTITKNNTSSEEDRMSANMRTNTNNSSAPNSSTLDTTSTGRRGLFGTALQSYTSTSTSFSSTSSSSGMFHHDGLKGSIGHWDQFAANEKLYGVKASFNENLYTTVLDVDSIDKAKREEAERLARDIEMQFTSNVHLAEERGQLIENDFDEEDLYSGVIRSSEGKNNTTTTTTTTATTATTTTNLSPSSMPSSTTTDTKKERNKIQLVSRTKDVVVSSLSTNGSTVATSATSNTTATTTVPTSTSATVSTTTLTPNTTSILGTSNNSSATNTPNVPSSNIAAKPSTTASVAKVTPTSASTANTPTPIVSVPENKTANSAVSTTNNTTTTTTNTTTSNNTKATIASTNATVAAGTLASTSNKTPLPHSASHENLSLGSTTSSTTSSVTLPQNTIPPPPKKVVMNYAAAAAKADAKFKAASSNTGATASTATPSAVPSAPIIASASSDVTSKKKSSSDVSKDPTISSTDKTTNISEQKKEPETTGKLESNTKQNGKATSLDNKSVSERVSTLPDILPKNQPSGIHNVSDKIENSSSSTDVSQTSTSLDVAPITTSSVEATTNEKVNTEVSPVENPMVEGATSLSSTGTTSQSSTLPVSKLNVNAKEFTFNPGAKSFTPSFTSTTSSTSQPVLSSGSVTPSIALDPEQQHFMGMPQYPPYMQHPQALAGMHLGAAAGTPMMYPYPGMRYHNHQVGPGTGPYLMMPSGAFVTQQQQLASQQVINSRSGIRVPREVTEDGRALSASPRLAEGAEVNEGEQREQSSSAADGLDHGSMENTDGMNEGVEEDASAEKSMNPSGEEEAQDPYANQQHLQVAGASLGGYMVPPAANANGFYPTMPIHMSQQYPHMLSPQIAPVVPQRAQYIMYGIPSHIHHQPPAMAYGQRQGPPMGYAASPYMPYGMQGVVVGGPSVSIGASGVGGRVGRGSSAEGGQAAGRISRRPSGRGTGRTSGSGVNQSGGGRGFAGRGYYQGSGYQQQGSLVENDNSVVGDTSSYSDTVSGRNMPETILDGQTKVESIPKEESSAIEN